MDGSQVGELEYENFNAAGAKIKVNGKIVHPGYAKGKLINSMLIANEFIAALPKQEVPERTSGYEGFFHLYAIEGKVEETNLQLIIRDHDKQKFQDRKVLLEKITTELNTKHGAGTVELEIKDQYFNMKEKAQGLNVRLNDFSGPIKNDGTVLPDKYVRDRKSVV